MMDSKEAFLSHLNSLDDDYYFFIATIVLGKVQTPFHKPVLNQRILSFLNNPTNRGNILASLDETDCRFLSFTMMLGRIELRDIREFFPEDSFPMVVTRMDSLCDRLILLRTDMSYRVNPVLEDDLRTCFRADLIFAEVKSPERNLPYVTRNNLFALLNLLTNGSVPVREANAHHFVKTNKLESVFPQSPKAQSTMVYEAIKDLALATGAVSVSSGRYILDPEKAKTLTRLDSLNLMLAAMDRRLRLPSKCSGLDLASSCSRLLGILKGHGADLRQARSLLSIMTGACRLRDSSSAMATINGALDLMLSFGFIVVDDGSVNLNPSVLEAETPMSRPGLDTDLVVSYYGIPPFDDILYLFADVAVCDKMVRYVISKESYNRAASLGVSQDMIAQYLSSNGIRSRLEQWKASFSRITLYDGILVRCDSSVAPMIMMHPELKGHIVQRIEDNLFLMRRSTFSEWNSILSYALDMQQLPLPISEGAPRSGQASSDTELFRIDDIIPERTEAAPTTAWAAIEEDLLAYARREGSLSDDVKELIRTRLIVSRDQIDRSFKYASMPTISGFDFNAKLAAIKGALKGKSPLMRLELTDETLIVKPVGITRGTATNSVVKVEVLPDGIERNIPVSSIFRITVLRWSIN